MFTPSDDEIAQFFESLSPEDFLSAPETTAFRTNDELYPRHGDDEYERFVLGHLSELAENEEQFAVLHNGEQERIFTPTQDERNLAEFLVRITKEVESFGAKWLFVGTFGEASIGTTFNPNDPKDVDKARRGGHLIDVINWYAESIEATSVDTRFGIIMNQEGEQQIVQSTFENGANPAFKRVLHIGE